MIFIIAKAGRNPGISSYASYSYNTVINKLIEY